MAELKDYMVPQKIRQIELDDDKQLFWTYINIMSESKVNEEAYFHTHTSMIHFEELADFSSQKIPRLNNVRIGLYGSPFDEHYSFTVQNNVIIANYVTCQSDVNINLFSSILSNFIGFDEEFFPKY